MNDTEKSHVSKSSLSSASQHGLALVELQGYVPPQKLIDLMAQLDAGSIDTEVALQTVDSWYTEESLDADAV